MATSSWNLATAARTWASVGAPAAGAVMSLAACLGTGSRGGLANPGVAELWATVGVVGSAPTTGSTACGLALGSVADE